MKDMKKLMGKDDGSGDAKKEAKLSVLKHMRKVASDMMGDDLKNGMEGMKKVTVAAPDTKGLKHGLDKAKDVLAEKDEDPMEEAMETPEEEMAEGHDEEDMTPDEIDAEIQHLMDLKKKLMENQ